MKLSIIVPAYNEERLIQRCLRSIRESARTWEASGWQHESIVCDNNSTDRTADLARAEGATVVFEPVNQIARARNRGAAAATGDWLIFVDADSFPDPGLFRSVAEAIRTGRYLGGGTTVRLEDVRGLPWLLNRLWNGISRLTGWVAGSFSFCRADVFGELGGFSETLFASEEIDFSRRLKRLARTRGGRTLILTGHPLRTSGRKARLCSPLEYGRLLLETIWHRGDNLKRREACRIWYDGRR